MNANFLKSFFIFLKKIIFIFSISFCTHAEIIVGSLNAESGQISDIAGIIIEAQRVAVENINSDNIGIQGQGLIELQRVDTACDPIVGISKVNAFINRYNPDIMLGPTCSSTTIAVAKNITIPNNILLLSSSASSPSISTLDDKNLVFRTIASDTQQAYTLAKYLISKNEKEVIILYENDQYNETLTQIFLQEYTEAGGTVKYKTQLTNKTIIDEKFINAFVTTAIASDQPVLLMFLHGNERTVLLLEQFVVIVSKQLQELGIDKIFSHHYGTDSMLTTNIRNLLYSYASTEFNNEVTIIAQASSQSSPEFQSYANIMLNAGVDPNSPYAALSFDTTIIAALALQHYFHNIDGNTSLSDSLFAIANPPGIKVGPASWQTARSLILRGVDINYHGVSGPLDFDSKGDVERLYSLNQVSEENTWIVEPIESFNPLKPQIFID